MAIYGGPITDKDREDLRIRILKGEVPSARDEKTYEDLLSQVKTCRHEIGVLLEQNKKLRSDFLSATRLIQKIRTLSGGDY